MTSLGLGSRLAGTEVSVPLAVTVFVLVTCARMLLELGRRLVCTGIVVDKLEFPGVDVLQFPDVDEL